MSTTDRSRNKPTEAGKNNDPDVRDESALQPGVSTVSNSEYDDDNQQLTKTAADDFREQNDQDPNADRSFDEVDEEP